MLEQDPDFDIITGIYTCKEPISKHYPFSDTNQGVTKVKILKPKISDIMEYSSHLTSKMTSKRSDGTVSYSKEYIESGAYRDDEWFQNKILHFLIIPETNFPLYDGDKNHFLREENIYDIIKILVIFREFFFMQSQIIRSVELEQMSLAKLLTMEIDRKRQEENTKMDSYPVMD